MSCRLTGTTNNAQRGRDDNAMIPSPEDPRSPADNTVLVQTFAQVKSATHESLTPMRH